MSDDSRPPFKYTPSQAETDAGMQSDEHIRRYEAYSFGMSIEEYRARLAAGQKLFVNLRN